MQVQSLQSPKGNSVCKNTSYNIEIVKISPPVFAQLTLLPTPEILCFTLLFSRLNTTKSPRSCRVLYTRVIHVPWTHLMQHPKLHLDWLS